MSFTNVGTTNAGTFTMQSAPGAMNGVPTMDADGIATGGAFLISELEKRDPMIRKPLTSFTYPRDIVIETGGGWVDYVSAIAEAMSWGPVETVQEIEAGADMTPYTGYDITNSKNRFLNEIFKGTNRTAAPNKVLLYRLGASGQEQATVEVAPLTVTAKYPGSRGNDISIVITELTTPADTFTVSTVVGGEIVDQQTAKTVENLVANDWVTFSGTGALAATAGTALTGGADGTPASADYTDFLTAIEPYKFDVLIYDGSDTTVQDAMVAFVKRLADEEGMYTQLVAAGLTNPDSRFVVNVQSGVTLNDGTALTPQQVTWWAGGALAGAQYNESLTYATYNANTSVEWRCGSVPGGRL